MEPVPSTSRQAMAMMARAGQQVRVQPQPIPIPAPLVARPCLANPVQVPAHFLVPPEQLLPHQVKSGIDIGNLFKLLNALQNRIALACSQHQYLSNPKKHPKPPDDGGYKPHTPEAAVRDIRSLCRQQTNLMEKLRRWNCLNEGNCYDLIMKNTYTGICSRCEAFAATRQRNIEVAKALRKQKKANVKARKKARKKEKKKLEKLNTAVKPEPPPPPPPPPPPSIQPVRKRRKIAPVAEPEHPESFLTQENFLSELGLVTPEVYQQVKVQSIRTERRRRTTANPKYRTTVVVDPKEAGKSQRSRRSDPESLKPEEPPKSSRSGAMKKRSKRKLDECSVCEKKEVEVRCDKCSSGFHADCIRVTGSRAPAPATVSVCPNCVKSYSHVSASDCILYSRRTCRTSIMGITSAEEKRANPKAGTSKNSNSAASKKKTKTNSKPTQQKSKSPAKAKKESVKQPAAPKRGKGAATSTKKSSSKPTLNHSLAVAAAAAVPAACCSNVREPKEEVPSTSKKAKTVQQPQQKQKIVPPVGIKWKVNNTKLRGGVRGRVYPKRDISPSSAIKPVVAKTANNKRVKASSLFATPEEIASSNSGTVNEKQQTQANTVKENGGSSKKINTFSITTSKPPTPPSSKTQTNSKAKPKVSKTKKASKEAIKPPPPSETIKTNTKATRSQGTSSKTKKPNQALKAGPIDTLSMTRTMLAMSAAAGIVLSTNGIKIPNAIPSSSTPQPTTEPVAVPLTPAPIAPIAPSATTTSSVETEERHEEVEKEVEVVRPPEAGPSGCTKKGKTKQTNATKKKPVQKSSPKVTIKIDPAMEQSISDSISRVILASTSSPEEVTPEVTPVKTPEVTPEVTLEVVTKAKRSGKKELRKSSIAIEAFCRSGTYNHNNTSAFLADELPILQKYNNNELKGDPSALSQDFFFSFSEEFPLDLPRSPSPASNSSTIGSPRSLGDLDSDDSSDLLSIPDTAARSYIDMPQYDVKALLFSTPTPSKTKGSPKKGRAKGKAGY